MSCEFYTEIIVQKPRKVYTCFGCRKQLPLNRKHYHITGKLEGEFFDSRICFACMKHLDKFSGDFRDGYGYGDIRSSRIDNVRCRRTDRRRKHARATQSIKHS